MSWRPSGAGCWLNIAQRVTRCWAKKGQNYGEGLLLGCENDDQSGDMPRERKKQREEEKSWAGKKERRRGPSLQSGHNWTVDTQTNSESATPQRKLDSSASSTRPMKPMRKEKTAQAEYQQSVMCTLVWTRLCRVLAGNGCCGAGRPGAGGERRVKTGEVATSSKSVGRTQGRGFLQKR